jgi:hypothetical protein
MINIKQVLFDILTGDISGLKNSLLLEFTKMVKETFHLIVFLQ